MPVAAIAVVARSEWARGWRGLLVLGVVAGLVGGLLVGGVALVRRTLSAPDRLVETVDPGDVRVQVLGSDIAGSIVDFDAVESSWSAGVAVGRLDGPNVMYVGLVAQRSADADLVNPVVVEGRAADPSRPAEVVVLEGPAAALDLAPGTQLGVTLLTPEEFNQFDVGFGEPDGPRLDLTVTGIVRVPPDILAGSPVIGTPALAEEIAPSFAGEEVYVRLGDGTDAAARFAEHVETLASSVELPPEAGEFPPVVTSDPRTGTEDLRRSARVLSIGLVAALAAGAVAALVALWQALSRHHAVSATHQRVEEALGLTATERMAARLVPGVAMLVVAAAIGAVVAFAMAGIEPPGALTRYEPHPGRRVDLPVVALGLAGVVVVVALIVGVTARRAGRRTEVRAAGRRSALWAAAPRRGGWPLAGVALALSSADRGSRLSARASVVAAVLGLAGITAAMVVGASLDRLTSMPPRYGWDGDLAVIDATDEIVAELAADERIGAVAETQSAPVELAEHDVQAYALTPVRGEVGWVVIDGRVPSAPSEVVLGRRVADRLGLSVGDDVDVDGRDGGRPLEVVGIGVGPALAGEPLGQSILVDPSDLAELAPVQSFREALVRAGPGTDPAALAEELGQRYEIAVSEMPPAVRDLSDLGLLPELFGGFLAVLSVLALAHALVVTTRRRAGDLAVLHALGSTPSEVGRAVLVMAVTVALAGIVIGVPLGWLTARLAWAEVARGAGVASDVVVPASTWAALLGALVVAAVVALVPARRAAVLPPAAVLRAE